MRSQLSLVFLKSLPLCGILIYLYSEHCITYSLILRNFFSPINCDMFVLESPNPEPYISSFISVFLSNKIWLFISIIWIRLFIHFSYTSKMLQSTSLSAYSEYSMIPVQKWIQFVLSQTWVFFLFSSANFQCVSHDCFRVTKD